MPIEPNIFPPNRSKRNLILIYIAAMPFIIIGALVSLGSVVETVEWGPFGVGMGIFGFGMLMFILAKYFTAARKISYKIDQEGIILKSTRGGTKQIPHSEIETVNLLIEKQAEEVLYKMRLKLEEKNAAIMRGEGKSHDIFGNLKEAFAEQKKSFSMYDFLSVPIMYKGRNRKGTTGANLPCDCVFILLKSGEGYLISPLDTEGFVNEVKKYSSMA